jgi:hypothetical protein
MDELDLSFLIRQRWATDRVGGLRIHDWESMAGLEAHLTVVENFWDGQIFRFFFFSLSYCTSTQALATSLDNCKY